MTGPNVPLSLLRLARPSVDGRAPGWLWLRMPALLAAIGLPFLVPSGYTYDLAQAAAVDAVLAVGYSVVQGLCGQFSVAHAAVYGVGAYTTAVATTAHGVPSGMALALSVAVTAVAGALLGLPALRIAGDQLAVVTLFAGGCLQLGFQNATSVTNGLGGISDIPPAGLLGHDFLTLREEYVLAAAALVVVVLLVESLRRSALGLAMVAVREDELGARSAGVRTGAYKVAAFTISGAVAGAAGWLDAGRYGTVTPDTFDLTLSVLIVSMVVLAGPGRTYGAVAAAGLLGTLERVLNDHTAIQQGATGLAIILVVLWRAGVLRDGLHRLPRRAPAWRRPVRAG